MGGVWGGWGTGLHGRALIGGLPGQGGGLHDSLDAVGRGSTVLDKPHRIVLGGRDGWGGGGAGSHGGGPETTVQPTLDGSVGGGAFGSVDGVDPDLGAAGRPSR